MRDVVLDKAIGMITRFEAHGGGYLPSLGGMSGEVAD